MSEARTKVRAAARPLAPHLQVYRWPITMGTSILHRMTGVGLSLGTLLLAWWLVAASDGPESYAVFEAAAAHWFGRLVLFGFTVALVYHAMMASGTCSGMPASASTSRLPIARDFWVYGLTLVTTIVIWVVAYQSMGAWQ